MKAVGKSVVLIILIIVMALSGLLWFDYLGIINAKKIFTPLYKVLGKEPQRSNSITQSEQLLGDIDDERLQKQRESLEEQMQELTKREGDIAAKEKLNEQLAAELTNKEKSQEEREKTFDLMQKQYDDKNLNIEQIATNLNGMTPQAAVNILLAMDDQMAIDVLRKVEELAARNNTSSMGSYWLSLMPADRAAIIQRKMLTKPKDL